MNYIRQNKFVKRVLKIFCLIILILSILILAKVYLPSFKKVDYRESIELSPNEIVVNVQFDYIPMKTPPIEYNNEVFLPVDFIKEYIDKYIYWDKKENFVTITNEKNVIRMKTEELEDFVNEEPLKLNAYLYNIDGVAYMSMLYLESIYQLEVYYNNKILSINKENYKTGTISKNVKLRKNPNIKSPYIKKIKKGSQVYFYENEENGYTKVDVGGYIGFVPTKLITNIKDKDIKNNYINDYKNNPNWNIYDGKINLVFDQISKVEANNTKNRRKYHDGVDVLVPTWFSFKDETGEIVNIADRGYVDWAHENGYRVWGLLTDNFDKKISHSILTSTETREYVIKQLLAYVSIYNLDGINIDFESVPKEDGDSFIQFLRELAPALRKQGVVLTVDLFVPKPWTAHYNRNDVGKIADYVIVMGYDEHYAGSEKAGSVASMSWSETAIKDTLAEGVPKNKLILGIPFYCRVWTETLEDGNIKLSSKAYSMQGAYDFIQEKGGTFIFDEETKQNYGEAKEGNKTYKVWLEDETSIDKRLDLVLEYDIAGAGAWKRGLEKEEIWTILKDKLKE
ncbi:glycosyl hydrolase family 18 protein [uncultured Tyzzerella sp.]|uniref:glycosyl hydrolase family 18 protein n=1 Tax=uncultured Tyzzerella sp. TaxID=2321398 RepID=UPI002943DECA|nr:glycosyl hydrolase family 18 protein [uncultured Tyzzerella sp.]